MTVFISGQFGADLFFTTLKQISDVFSAVYTLVTEIPAVFLLFNSPTWSSAFLLFILGITVWNGSGFYIEVFGRKYVLIFTFWHLLTTRFRFERELEALRKEIAESTRANGIDTPTDLSRTGSLSDLSSLLSNGSSSSESGDNGLQPESKKDQ